MLKSRNKKFKYFISYIYRLYCKINSSCCSFQFLRLLNAAWHSTRRKCRTKCGIGRREGYIDVMCLSYEMQLRRSKKGIESLPGCLLLWVGDIRHGRP